MTVEILYSDEHGTDMLVGGRHNVNLDYEHDTLSEVTHRTRDGAPMQVLFHPAFRTYFVLVGK